MGKLHSLQQGYGTYSKVSCLNDVTVWLSKAEQQTTMLQKSIVQHKSRDTNPLQIPNHSDVGRSVNKEFKRPFSPSSNVALSQ